MNIRSQEVKITSTEIIHLFSNLEAELATKLSAVLRLLEVDESK